MFGSDRNGFSPIMYMPRTPPLSAERDDLGDGQAALGVELAPHAASKRSRTPSASTGW